MMPFLDFEVLGFGMEFATEIRFLKSPIREYYRIHFIFGGCDYLRKKDKNYTVQENCGFIVFPGEEVNYYPSIENPSKYFWCAVRGEGIQQKLKSLHLTRDNPVFSSKLNKKDTLQLLYAFFSLSESTQSIINENLITILDEMQVQPSAAFSDSRVVEKALSFIHDNYNMNIAIGDIASILFVDRTYLFKLFKQKLNISPQGYLISYRLTKAFELLKTTKKSVTEISLEIGFNSFSNFSKQFKNKYGVSPAHIRNQLGDRQ